MLTVNTSMQGKTCMVTGANSGIGKATALGLAQMGANVVMVARDRARGEVAQNQVKAKSGNNSVDLLVPDLSSQHSIRHLVANFKHHSNQLLLLITNPGWRLAHPLFCGCEPSASWCRPRCSPWGEVRRLLSRHHPGRGGENIDLPGHFNRCGGRHRQILCEERNQSVSSDFL